MEIIPRSVRRLSTCVFYITLVAAIVLVIIRHRYLLVRRSLVLPVSSLPHMSSSSNGDHKRYSNDYSATYAAVSTVDGTPTVVNGHSFVFAADYLSGLGFPIVFKDTSTDLSTRRTTVDDIVFVTASDSRFTMVNMDAIALVQQHFPQNSIVFYDLSSEKRPQAEVEKIKRLCNVEYRRFDYSCYPSHVRSLQNYAWKVIIIHEILNQSHKVMFWMDASIRFKSRDFDAALRKADVSGGMVLFDFSGHTIFPATHSKLYEYLPIDRALAINAGMYGAGAILIRLNRELYESVISWWFLCALTADCMAPTTDISCKFSKVNSTSTYANCHRFDQSVLNILLANHFSGSRRRLVQMSDDIERRQAAAAVNKPEAKTTPGGAGGPSVTENYVAPGPLTVERGSQFKEQISVCDDKVERLTETVTGLSKSQTNSGLKRIPPATYFNAKR